MDDFKDILEAAMAAQQRGADMGEVNKYIKEATGLENLPALITVARGGEGGGVTGVSERDEAIARIGQGGGSATGDFLRMAGQGLTFDFGDEIAGAGAALGALAPGGRSPGEAFRETTDASRQRVADLRTANPGASMAAEVAGGLLLPGAGAAKVGKNGGSLTRGLLTGSTRPSAIRSIGMSAGDDALRATRGTLRAAAKGGKEAAGVMGRGAAAGGLFGGLQGAGRAEGGLVERGKGALEVGIPSAAFGGAAAGLFGAVPSVVTGMRGRAARNRARNPRIAHLSRNAANEEGVTNLPSQMLRQRDEAKDAIHQAFQQLDEAPPIMSNQMKFALGDPLNAPAFRAEFRNHGLESHLRRFEDAINKPSGTRGAGLKFEDIQRVRGTLQDQIDDQLRRTQGGGIAQELIKRKNRFDDAVEEMLPNQSVRMRWRQVSQVDDGLSAGAKAANGSIDAARLLESQFKDTGGEALQAFRAGMLDNIINKISDRGGTTQVSDKLIQQLDIGLGGNVGLRNEILGIIETESRGAAAEKIKETIAKTLGFIFGGSSLVGAGVVSLGG